MNTIQKIERQSLDRAKYLRLVEKKRAYKPKRIRQIIKIIKASLIILMLFTFGFVLFSCLMGINPITDMIM